MRYLLLLAALLAGGLGYTAYYFVVAERLDRGVRQWLEARRADGMIARHDGLDGGGFPFRVVLRLAAPALALPEAAGRPAWRAERLSLAVQPWKLSHAIVDLSGRGAVEFDDGRRRHFDYALAEGLASRQGDGEGRLLRLSADLHRLSLAEPGGPQATLARGQLHARPGADGVLQVALKLDRLRLDPATLPPEARPPAALGPEIALVEAEFELERAPAFGGDPEAWLRRWRDAGGDLQLRRFRLAWGEVEIEASGTLALDDRLRPIGALTARVRGHEHLVEAALAAGQIGEEAAANAKALLDLLAQAGGGILSVPLTMQDGFVFLGPAPLARLAPVLPPAGRSPAPPSPAPPR